MNVKEASEATVEKTYLVFLAVNFVDGILILGIDQLARWAFAPSMAKLLEQTLLVMLSLMLRFRRCITL